MFHNLLQIRKLHILKYSQFLINKFSLKLRKFLKIDQMAVEVGIKMFSNFYESLIIFIRSYTIVLYKKPYNKAYPSLKLLICDWALFFTFLNMWDGNRRWCRVPPGWKHETGSPSAWTRRRSWRAESPENYDLQES